MSPGYVSAQEANPEALKLRESLILERGEPAWATGVLLPIGWIEKREAQWAEAMARLVLQIDRRDAQLREADLIIADLTEALDAKTQECRGWRAYGDAWQAQAVAHAPDPWEVWMERVGLLSAGFVGGWAVGSLLP